MKRRPQQPTDQKLLDIINKACDDYEGDCAILESAIGALVWGRRIGWKALRLMHSGRTFIKYEEILGVKFKEILPENTGESERMDGYRMYQKIGKFWQAITSGMIPAKEAANARAM